MNRGDAYLAVLLAAVWVVLCGDLSLTNVVTGVLVGFACMYFCHKFIPLNVISVDFFKLVTYPFYLVGQVYVAGFAATKIILTGASVGIVEVKTKITDNFLKVVLVNSITLIPGSVTLDLQGDTITILWLRGKADDPQDTVAADKLLKSELEKKLLRAQK